MNTIDDRIAVLEKQVGVIAHNLDGLMRDLASQVADKADIAQLQSQIDVLSMQVMTATAELQAISQVAE